MNGTVLPRLTPPTNEELGYCDVVCVEERGDTPLVVFRLEGKESRLSTIVIRGATDNYMDDIERAIDDGVNTFKVILTIFLYLFHVALFRILLVHYFHKIT